MVRDKIAAKILACFERGGKVIIFGNGGSLADASHFAAEFHNIGPVIALNDPIKITSIGNDIDFSFIFVRQVMDIANPQDLVIGLSSSGKSPNVNLALGWAAENDIATLDFPRKGHSTQQVQNYQYQLLHDIYAKIKAGYED